MEALLIFLQRVYEEKGGHTGGILEPFLSLLIDQSCTNFVVKPSAALAASASSLAVEGVAELIKQFQMESVLIWVASLLKKRVVIYHSDPITVQNLVRACACIGAWHRQDSSVLHCYMTLDENDEKELSSCVCYVAGFVDANVSSRTSWYDLFVDAHSSSITVNDTVQKDFAMSKVHKQIAQQLVQVSEQHQSFAAIQGVASITAEFLEKVDSLKVESNGGCFVTPESIAEHQMQPALSRFIYNVAVAEGWTPP